jgi:hypothetical protein
MQATHLRIRVDRVAAESQLGCTAGARRTRYGSVFGIGDKVGPTMRWTPAYNIAAPTIPTPILRNTRDSSKLSGPRSNHSASASATLPNAGRARMPGHTEPTVGSRRGLRR